MIELFECVYKYVEILNCDTLSGSKPRCQFIPTFLAHTYPILEFDRYSLL